MNALQRDLKKLVPLVESLGKADAEVRLKTEPTKSESIPAI